MKRGDFQLLSWKWGLEHISEQGRGGVGNGEPAIPQEAEHGPCPIWKKFVLHSPAQAAAVTQALLPVTALTAGHRDEGVGSKGRPSGWGDMPWQGMQREETQREGIFLPLPPLPLPSSEQDRHTCGKQGGCKS